MSFKEQIEDLAGAIPVGVDAKQFLTDGIWDVINRIGKVSPQFLSLFSSSTAVSDGNGLDINNIIILDVARDDRPCSEIQAQRRFDAVDSDSIYYITKNYPTFYVYNGKLHIVPAPTAIETGSISIASAGTINSWDTGTSTVDNYPEALYRLLVIFAAMRVLLAKMTATDTPADITLPTLPSAPTLETVVSLLPTFTPPLAPVLPSAPVNADITFDDTDKPTLGSVAQITLPILDIEAYGLDIADLDLSGTVLPSPPSAPSFPDGSTTLPDNVLSYTAPTITLEASPVITPLAITASVPTQPTAPDFATDGAVDALGDAPVYIQPVMSIESKLEIAELTATIAALTLPVEPSIAYIDAVVGTIAETTITSPGTAPTFTKPSITLDVAPTITDLSLTTTAITTLPAVIDTATEEVDFTDVEVNLPVYTQPVHTLEAHPVLKTLGALPSVPSTIAAPSITATTIAGVTVDPTTFTALADVPGYIQPISPYSATQAETYIRTDEDIELAQAEIQKLSTELNDYQMSLYNELNRVNTDIEVYKATLQQNIQQAQITLQEAQKNADFEHDATKTGVSNKLQAEIKEYELTLQKYNSDINAYQAELNEVITEYTAQNNIIIQEWQAYNSSAIQKYSVDIQNELNEFNESVAIFNAYVQKAFKDADLASSSEELKANLVRFQSDVQRYSAEVNAEIQEWKVNADKDIQLWRDYNASKIAVYNADIQNELGEFNAEFGVYNATIQTNIEQARLTIQENIQRAGLETDINKTNEYNTMNALVADYQNLLQRFQADVQRYGAEVNKAVAFWQTQHAIDIQNWQTYNASMLQKYATDIQNQVNVFNEDVVYFQADLQRKIANASNTLQGSSQEYSMELQRYSLDIQKYQAEVNEEAQTWSLNTNKELTIWTTKTQNALAQYASDIQNALAAFNETNALYQSTMQKALQDAQLGLSSASEEYKSELQLYQSELQAYQIQTNNQVQIWSQSVVQEALTVFTSRTANALQKYQTDVSGSIQKFSTEASTNVQNFQASIQLWGKIVDRQIAEYQVRTGYDLGLYNAEIQAELGEYNVLLETAKTELLAETQAYQLETQGVIGGNQNLVSMYGVSVQAYASQVQALVQDYTARLQAVQLEYTWLIQEYNILKMEYEAGFVPFQQKESK